MQQANNNEGKAPNHGMTTLYVTDLHYDVTEAMLFEKFSWVGPVLSIRVCRDMITGRSLGSAYVNFKRLADAERALNTMNFDIMKGRAIRIIWSQPDPSPSKSGHGSIFINNLDKSIDSKDIYDLLSDLGTILSSNFATDEHGESKGYGFVHFESEEAANIAIEESNGKLLRGKKVFFGRFIPSELVGEEAKRFTNVYVKNFPDTINEEKLRKIFEKFGAITSCRVMSDENGKSRGFGFVAFEDAETAEVACNEMNGKNMEGKTLYVGPAQKRAERQMELKRKFEVLKMERMTRRQGVNVYVKNLDDTFEDEKLRQEFAPYGTITSAKVMVEDDGRSKGFGFVCFSSPEEATKAITEMNGRIVGTKPLYVALALRKNLCFADFFVQDLTQQAQRFYTPAQMAQIGPSQRWAGQPNMRQPAAGPAGLFSSIMQPRFRREAGNPLIRKMEGRSTTGAQPNGVLISGQEPLSASAFAAAHPNDQKQMLGERLFPLIQDKHPGVAGKITGMLIELDNEEILHLLEDRELLASRIDEAIAVLSIQQSKQAGQLA